MEHDQTDTGKREPVNLSLDTCVATAAREVGINLSKVSEAALQKATRIEQDRRWNEGNRDWIEAHSACVPANALPLERCRLF